MWINWVIKETNNRRTEKLGIDAFDEYLNVFPIMLAGYCEVIG